nr:MAG TPA: hypothetical protein [Caudoviricetes sp.]
MKNRAEKYADLQCKLQHDAPEEVPDLSKGIFGHEDIVNAFNAGCKSVLKNIPKLDWETLKDGSLKASTPFGCYNIDKNEYGFNDYIISSISGETKTVFGKQNAILAANEDYKKRIIQALDV